MTIDEKFNQIIALLPDDNTPILVAGAQLCLSNDYCEHSLASICKRWNGFRWVIRYRTINGYEGSINIYDACDAEKYIADLKCLYNWLTANEYFGRYERNLF